jgi:uncharacterized protein (DUF2249 family)
MTSTPSKPVLDVRTIAPRDRHPLIFSTFAALGLGEAMELINDHDPRPLYHQFQAQSPGTFSWRYLAEGPDVWHVEIVRNVLAKVREPESCCGGGCGGGR